MDEFNKQWLHGKPNWWFRYKQKVVEKLIIGTCLNAGCGDHIIKEATNINSHATKLPYKNNSFDTIILSDVIEHINKYKKAISEAKRVSKKRVIITVPAYQWLYSDYDKILGHKKRFKKSFFKNIKTTYLFGFLLPIFILRKVFNIKKTPRLPWIIDEIFYLLAHIRLPFGSTILVIIEK